MDRPKESKPEFVVDRVHKYFTEQNKLKALQNKDEKHLLKMDKEMIFIKDGIKYVIKNELMKEEKSANEDFTWINYKDANYICICTKGRCMFNKGEQIYFCYGCRTNRFLMIKYSLIQLWVLLA